MRDIIIAEVKKLFDQGRIKGLVAPRAWGAHVAPHVFTAPEELEQVSLGDRDAPGDTRYALVKLLCKVVEAYPTDSFALLVRGCDERAVRKIMETSRLGALNDDRIVLVGFSCPSDLAQKHRCLKPWPDALVAGEKTPGVTADEAAPQIDDIFELLDEWYDIFNRCLKCFGCRNVCPVCDCQECTMEVEALVPQRQLPINPSFLLTRAVHMVDRCVYCGLCEEACPADIPLKELYRAVAGLVGVDSGLLPGTVPDRQSASQDFFSKIRAK